MSLYHLDCASGIAGDMFLGACLDLGMPMDVVGEAVSRLRLPGVGLESRKAVRGGLTGTRFRVLVDGRPVDGLDPEETDAEPGGGGGVHHHGHEHGHSGHTHPRGGHGHEPPHSEPSHSHAHRGLGEILHLLTTSGLPPGVEKRACALFRRLGEAEAKVHGVPLEAVHFHEVGAVDAIVDLVGAAAAFDYLRVERITCGPVNLGSGQVRTAHGELPVPAPATAELLRGVPVYSGPGGELTTPTGAVLLAELVDEFVEMPRWRLEGTGYGLGKKHLPHQANALRLHRGAAAFPAALESHMPVAGLVPQRPVVAVVECEIDDLPGEAFGYLMERLLDQGALDVFFTPVQMKKNRPGTLVSLLCRAEKLESLAALLLLESGSLGCRYHWAERFEAERATREVETPFGRVRIKEARLQGGALAASPEYDDCRRLALERGVPWREVYRAALLAAGR